MFENDLKLQDGLFRKIIKKEKINQYIHVSPEAWNPGSTGSVAVLNVISFCICFICENGEYWW